MPKIYDQQTTFKRGGDSGQNTDASIQPIAGGEALWEDPLNRSPGNLRHRTEALRTAVDDLRYYADYDRALILRADATTFTFTQEDPTGDPGAYRLRMTGGPLWVLPALTPGTHSGGRPGGARMFVQNGPEWTAYAGNLGASDLSFTASSTYTGMRGYADADNLATEANGLSLGANRLTITLVADAARAGGVAAMSLAVTGNPAVNITITYGTLTPTTINDVIAKVNADETSQVTYGLSHLVRASTSSSGTSAPPAITNAVFQGAYDAEAHQVTLAALDGFFTAQDVATLAYHNRLQEGEGLALFFEAGPVERGLSVPKGGRRQSIYDLPNDKEGDNDPNTAPATGWNLFNTGREPEKIPGSVPIGKMKDGRFIFIDGTIVGTTPISLSESDVTMNRLAAQSGTTGASLIGYGGSVNWQIPAGTVENALDSVDSILFAATGSSKIGYDGSPNSWIPAGKVDAALDAVDTALASQTATTGAARIGYGGSVNAWIPQGTVEAALDAVDTALALQTGTTGAARVGYGGSVAWHSDSAAPTALPASTVEVAIDNVVTQLKATDLTVSGGRKVGTSAITGTGASPGNTNFSLTASSVWGQFNQLLANANGLNSRVIESGHRLTTAAPLRKEFGYAGMPTGGGAVMFQAELHAPGNLYASTPDGYREYASLNLQPIVYNAGGAGLIEDNPVAWSTGDKSTLAFTAIGGFFEPVFNKIPTILNTENGSNVPLIFVKIKGLSSTATPGVPAKDADGLYNLRSYNLTTKKITLTRLDGTAPDFSADGAATDEPTSGTATIMSSIAVGSDESYTRLTAYIRSDLVGNGVGRPWAILGAANTTTRILETYTPGLLGAGVLKGTLYPDKAVFVGSKRGDSSVVVYRDTTNILKSNDKNVLDGNETGTAIDASSSHHHGSIAQSYFPAVVTANIPFGDINTFPALGPSAHSLGIVFVNAWAAAVILTYTITTTRTGSGSTSTAFTLQFMDHLGNVVHEQTESYSVASSPAVLVTTRSAQIIVPVAAPTDAPGTGNRTYISLYLANFTISGTIASVLNISTQAVFKYTNT